jgi:outer membrane protein assembly factor BamB
LKERASLDAQSNIASKSRSWTVRLVLLPVLILIAAGCDWTTFGYGPTHTRYNPDETLIGTANVSTLKPAWAAYFTSGGRSSPSIANGIEFIGSDDGKLYAFDASGSTGCSGTPKICAPLWTDATGGPIASSPAVVNGVVYVGSSDDKLYAFDASGTTGCSGTPKTCTPLWTATTGGAIASSPTVANGSVYIGSGDHKLYAFSAAGTTGCSGTPKVCSPLWTATTGGVVDSSPAVDGGSVYVASGDGMLYAFDAAGTTGCSGTPKTCTAKWSGAIWAGNSISSSPSIAGGVVYVGRPGFLYAFDEAGKTNCVAASCKPLWTAATGSTSSYSSPAVANGTVFINSTDGKLYAFSAAGSTGCSGTPKTCTPLWTAVQGNNAAFSSPAIANGVIYVTSNNNSVYGFDASGTTKCAGTPKVCSPLWTSATAGTGIQSSPAVNNGMLYVSTYRGALYAFKPTPATS